MHYIESNNVLDDRQSGFRKGYSTSKMIGDLTDDISVNKNKITSAVFIDFKKAFDTVDHDILNKKLNLLEIQDTNLRLLIDYLSNRKQRTQANNTISGSQEITCGVSQGSILRPLLFLIYVNGMPKHVARSKVQLYADDTVLYCSNKDIRLSIGYLQEDVYKIQEWCNLNKLTVNLRKTKTLPFSTKQKLKKFDIPEIRMQNIPIGTVATYKIGLYMSFLVVNR